MRFLARDQTLSLLSTVSCNAARRQCLMGRNGRVLGKGEICAKLPAQPVGITVARGADPLMLVGRASSAGPLRPRGHMIAVVRFGTTTVAVEDGSVAFPRQMVRSGLNRRRSVGQLNVVEERRRMLGLEPEWRRGKGPNPRGRCAIVLAGKRTALCVCVCC